MATHSLEQRLADSVSRKLGGVPVGFVRWILRTTGDVPVFRVPDGYRTQAMSLGLTVETLEEKGTSL